MMDLDHELAYFLYHVSNSNPDYENAWRLTKGWHHKLPCFKWLVHYFTMSILKEQAVYGHHNGNILAD